MSESQSFQNNYAVLKQVAEYLRTQTEPNIDELIPMIQKATAAYKACQARLETVQKELVKYQTPSDEA